MSDEREDAIEKALAALGRADVPEGLEARVLDGVARRAGSASRDAGMGAAWWRGALSGAAFAMGCVGLAMMVQHGLRGAAGSSHGVAHFGMVISSAEAGAGRPCASDSLLHVRSVAQTQGVGERMRVERSEPVAVAPLTAEERELVRLARTADPKDLATLNPEVRARLDAEDAASFQSFFAAPKTQPVAVTEPNTGEPAGEPSLETPADPATTQPAESEPSTKANTGESQ